VRVAESKGRLNEQFVAPSEQELEFLDRHGVHPEGNGRVEVSLVSVTWMDRIAAAFHSRRGFAVLIDYGYTREQQLVGRHCDTVMTYRRHRADSSVYDAPGGQDITAHVNFTALSNVAKSRGMEPAVLLTQSQFLIGIGEESQFADAFEGCRLPQERAKVALQLKHLISPEGMGEVFQVLVLSRGVDKEKAAQLSGLAFLR
jgi:SAM-dependent MidA family methyltransferase